MATDWAVTVATAPATDRRLLTSPVALWGGFVAVHVFVGILALAAPGPRLGDVSTVYLPWALQAQHGSVPGIDSPWVYPVVAIVPIMLPLIAGAQHYVAAWLLLVVLADAAAFAVLVASRRLPHALAAWWWLGFTLLLGPVAIARLDTLCVPLVILGLLALARHPRTAAVLLTIGTWVKVWPAAVLAAVAVASGRRRLIVGTAAIASGAIAAAALLLGAGGNLLSFVTAQADRGLQVESPVGTVWMWQAALQRPGSFVYYDRALNTFQVTGPGITAAIGLMSPLLLCVVVAVLLVGVRAVWLSTPRRDEVATGAVARVLPPRVLAPLALALVSALIAVNKVGSPQYMLWLVPAVVLGVAVSPRAWLTPAILVAALAGLTQVFYPYLYLDLLGLNPLLLGVLTLRNLLLFLVLAWAIVRLWRQPHRPVSQSKE